MSSGLRVQQNVSLRDFNYLRFDSVAETFAFLDNRTAIPELCELVKKHGEFKILGEGSNVLLGTPRFPLLVQVAMKGIVFTPKGDDVLVKVEAGESWMELVDLTASRGLFGIETLALIPGSVGAAPVQNIGAYGQEVGNVIEDVEVLNLRTGKTQIYRASECEFKYRSSIFKKPEHRDDVILSVTLKLSAKAPAGVSETPTEIAERTKQTRRSKLPDPKVTPNVGSFFHNPVLTEAELLKVKSIAHDVPVYPHGEFFKVSAAWLIERSGWKGHREGDVGVSPQHALVLVNYAATTAAPLLDLASKITKDVEAKFGVRLAIEPARF